MPLSELRGALTPEDVASECKRRYEKQLVSWLAGVNSGDWPQKLTIGSPSEGDAAASPAALRSWIGSWKDFDASSTESGRDARIVWRTVNWRALGTVEMPQKLSLGSPEAFATCAGKHSEWLLLNARWAAICSQFSAVRDHPGCARAIVDTRLWPETDFARLLTFLGWAGHNKDCGLYLRQLPLVGIDTKWVESRLGVVEPFLGALLGRVGGIQGLLGLKGAPFTIRVRLLDQALRDQLGGAEDLQMPVSQWSTCLRQPPKRLLIVENLATGLALPDMPATAVVMGLGNGVSALQDLQWAKQSDPLYWGDIDTWGLHILSRARAIYPALRSVLMSEAVLETHRDLWAVEAQQDLRPALNLTPEESRLLGDLQSGRWGQKIRLEQERIHWPTALQTISFAWLD
jgi:hypothetical protein